MATRCWLLPYVDQLLRIRPSVIEEFFSFRFISILYLTSLDIWCLGKVLALWSGILLNTLSLLAEEAGNLKHSLDIRHYKMFTLFCLVYTRPCFWNVGKVLLASNMEGHWMFLLSSLLQQSLQAVCKSAVLMIPWTYRFYLAYTGATLADDAIFRNVKHLIKNQKLIVLTIFYHLDWGYNLAGK